MKFHQQKHSQNTVEMKCTICEKVYSSQKALKMHERSHSIHVSDGKMQSSKIKMTDTPKVDAHKSTESDSNLSSIYCEKVNNNQWFRCKLCPKIRSADINTIMSHVCLTHSMDTVSEKVILKDHQKIE